MRKYLLLSLFCLLALPKIGYASIVINEIMYDATGTDTGHEWVEVYNNGGESVDLAGYKFVEAGTKHGLTPQGSTSLAGGAYAIISDNATVFKSDHPNYSGILFDSSFSLSNETGETIEIYDGSAVLDTVSYTPPSDSQEGKTLGLLSGNWSLCNTTPGGANEKASSGGGGGSNNGGGGENEEVEVVKRKIEQDVRTVNVSIIHDEIIEPKVPAQFYGKAGSNKGEIFLVGKYVWNFGDGISETKYNEPKITHTYKYAGDYVVTLAYYESSLMADPTTIDRAVVSVTEASIIISKTGALEDPYIELTNISKHETNLGGWSIIANGKVFIIPKDTIILAGKKIIVSSEVTNFNYNDIITPELKYPNNVLAYSGMQNKKVNYTNSIAKSSTSVDTNGAIEAKVLGVEASQNLVESYEEKTKLNETGIQNKSKAWVWILFIFLLLLAGGVSYFIYKKPTENKADENDFEIIE